jgi:ABC-type multidrug transport system fused ATPase/permease subunit
VLLLYNTAYWRSSDLSELRTPRRYWEDVSIAASRLLADPAHGASPISVGSPPGQARIDDYARFLQRGAEAQDLKPWEFWRTLRMARFIGLEPLEARGTDDPGRAMLLTLGFRALGGVSPYLGLWLGAFFCVPLLLWAAWELARAGWSVAAAVVPLLMAASPYVVEVLSLPYSAVGFYVLTLVALVPFATFAVRGPVETLAPLLVRTLAAGVFFALGVLCRSGALLLLPGFVLALWIAWRRRAGVAMTAVDPTRQHRLRRLAVAAGLVVLFLGPYAVVRQPRHHEIWLGIWEGAGDFDRTKGHYWLDAEAKRVLREAGREAREDRAIWSRDNEAFFRDRLLADVAQDPGWYSKILAQRVVATVTQSKLAPFRPRDGRSFARHESPQEGAIDVYYRMTTQVDFLGLGPWKLELPLSVLWMSLLLWVALVGAGGRLGASERLQGSPWIVGSVALAACASPVLITTASALETQAFALVHLLAAAFVFESVAGRLAMTGGRS